MAEVNGHKDLVLGFYRRPIDGDVVHTSCYINGMIHWQTDGGEHGQVTCEELSIWEFLNGAHDFPDAKDPRLPYEFDLWYDVHNVSQLVREFGGWDNVLGDEHIQALCSSYDIDLRNPQTIRDYNERIREAANE